MPSNHDKIPLHIELARKYVGVKEKGQNRGKEIDEFNKFVGNPLGSPYCAAFVCYILNKANVKDPKIKTGLASKLKNKKSISALKIMLGLEKVMNGDIIIWQKGDTKFGHAGFASEDWIKTAGMSIQANTFSKFESRNGDGISEKIARIEPLNYFRIVGFTRVIY